MRPFSSQGLKGNATELQAEAKAELLQWVWGPFNFERLVVISLILQFILFFGAPFRKSTANGMGLTFIWAAYLLADLVSYYSIGLVLNGQSGRDNNHLHVLWGSLLLAHLSGPHTISVLDMEDHHLWSRTALKFGTIAYAIARITSKTFTQNGNAGGSCNISHPQAHSLVYVPTLALFMVGIVKILEKIATLIVNRTTFFQDRVIRKIKDPSKARLVQGTVLVRVADKPKITMGRGMLSPIEALRDAYRLFKVFRRCYVDFKLQFEDGGSSIREYFLNRTPQDAFLVIETELNFMYDVFYTKDGHFYKLGVQVVRYMTVVGEFVAFGFLATEQVNDNRNWFDIPITHSLVLGALFMDIIAALQMSFSVWAILHTDVDTLSDDRDDLPFREWLLNKILTLRRRAWGRYSSRKEISCLQQVRRVLFRRWSESISQFNFIDYCLRPHPRMLQTVYSFLGIKEDVHKATYVDHVWFTDPLRNFIFDELKRKARLHQNLDSRVSRLYSKWIQGRDLDECLLIWHIATNFCWTDSDDDESAIIEDRSIIIEDGSDMVEDVPVIIEDESIIVEDGPYWRKWSETLSDYMLCLLIQHPKILKEPEVGLMAKLRLESACESCGASKSLTPSYCRWGSKRHKEARSRMLNQMRGSLQGNDQNHQMDEMLIKGNQLAEQLKEIGSQKWEVASKVWVELLCLTAAKTNPSAHIRMLNKGSELITLVWLLMHHLGIGNRGSEVEMQTLRPTGVQ